MTGKSDLCQTGSKNATAGHSHHQAKCLPALKSIFFGSKWSKCWTKGQVLCAFVPLLVARRLRSPDKRRFMALGKSHKEKKRVVRPVLLQVFGKGWFVG